MERGFEGKINLAEVVEKKNSAYSEREQRLLGRLFPTLKSATTKEIADIFRLGEKQLSYFEICSLCKIFPEQKPSEIVENLTDIEKFQALVDQSGTSEERRNELWRTLAILPLSADQRHYLISKFSPETTDDTFEQEDQENEDDSEKEPEAKTITRSGLPWYALPQFKTYIRNKGENGEFFLPPAIISVTWADGTRNTEVLSQNETAAAMQLARETTKYIGDNFSELAVDYLVEENKDQDFDGDQFSEASFEAKKAKYQQKLEDIEADPELCNDIKLAAFHRIFAAKFARYWQDSGHIQDSYDVDKIFVKFTQYKKGADKAVKTHLASEVSIKKLFESRHEKRQIEKAGGVPEMISAESLLPVLLNEAGTFYLKDSTEESPRAPKVIGEQEKWEKDRLNQLQQAYLEVSRATESGDWDKAIEIYLQYLNFWPQYLEHRLAVRDLVNKHEQGIIPALPQTVLSVASGPHEELRAHADLAEHLADYQIPQIVNIDSSAKMLEESRKTLPPEAKKQCVDIIGDMREVPTYLGQFDLVECSSLDNLKEESDLRELLGNLLKSVKKDGLIRLMHDQPLSDQAVEILKKHGINILEHFSRFQLTDETKAAIKHARGQKVLQRIEYKLRRHSCFMAQVTTEIDSTVLLRDLGEVPLFAEKHRSITEEAADEARKFEEDYRRDEAEYNALLTLALNPAYYCQKKNISPRIIGLAIDEIAGNLDYANAVRLFKRYFNFDSADDELFARFRPQIMEIATKHDLREGLTLDLLVSLDDESKKILEHYITSHLDRYFRSLITSEKIPSEEKRNLLQGAKFSDRIAESAANFFNGLDLESRDEVEIENMFNLLPADWRFPLSAKYLMKASLAHTYYRVTDIEPKEFIPDENTVDEILRSFELNPEFAMNQAVEFFNSVETGEATLLSRKFLTILRTRLDDPAIITFIQDNRGILLTLAKEVLSVEDSADKLPLLSFARDYLGAEINRAEAEEAVCKSLASEFNERYDNIVAKRIRPENLEGEINQLIEDLSAKYARGQRLFWLDFKRIITSNFSSVDSGKRKACHKIVHEALKKIELAELSESYKEQSPEVKAKNFFSEISKELFESVYVSTGYNYRRGYQEGRNVSRMVKGGHDRIKMLSDFVAADHEFFNSDYFIKSLRQADPRDISIYFDYVFSSNLAQLDARTLNAFIEILGKNGTRFDWPKIDTIKKYLLDKIDLNDESDPDLAKFLKYRSDLLWEKREKITNQTILSQLELSIFLSKPWLIPEEERAALAAKASQTLEKQSAALAADPVRFDRYFASAPDICLPLISTQEKNHQIQLLSQTAINPEELEKYLATRPDLTSERDLICALGRKKDTFVISMNYWHNLEADDIATLFFHGIYEGFEVSKKKITELLDQFSVICGNLEIMNRLMVTAREIAEPRLGQLNSADLAKLISNLCFINQVASINLSKLAKDYPALLGERTFLFAVTQKEPDLLIEIFPNISDPALAESCAENILNNRRIDNTAVENFYLSNKEKLEKLGLSGSQLHRSNPSLYWKYASETMTDSEAASIISSALMNGVDTSEVRLILEKFPNVWKKDEVVKSLVKFSLSSEYARQTVLEFLPTDRQLDFAHGLLDYCTPARGINECSATVSDLVEAIPALLENPATAQKIISISPSLFSKKYFSKLSPIAKSSVLSLIAQGEHFWPDALEYIEKNFSRISDPTIIKVALWTEPALVAKLANETLKTQVAQYFAKRLLRKSPDFKADKLEVLDKAGINNFRIMKGPRVATSREGKIAGYYCTIFVDDGEKEVFVPLGLSKRLPENAIKDHKLRLIASHSGKEAIGQIL